MLPWKCFSSCTVLKKFKLRNEKTNMSEFLCQEHPLMNRSVRRLTVEPIRTTTLLVRPRRAEQSPTSRAEYFCWCERKKSLVFILFIEILLLEPSCPSAHRFSITQRRTSLPQVGRASVTWRKGEGLRLRRMEETDWI